jgi:UrcA family protein
MTHSKCFSSETVGTKTVARRTALCAIGMFAALQVQQSAIAADRLTAKVSTADLDLGTSAGMLAAEARVRETARRLCRQLEDLDDLSRQSNYTACVDASVTAAMQSVKRLALAALAKQTPTMTR